MTTEVAVQDLHNIISAFNLSYREWESKHNCGANFAFRYDPETGKKNIEVLDVAATDPNKPASADDTRVINAQVMLNEALGEST